MLPKFTFLLVLFFVFLWICIRNPKRGFLWAIFLLPWFGLEIDVGVGITPYQVMIMCLVISIPLFNRGFKLRTENLSRALKVFIFYAVIWSAIQITILPESTEVIRGGLFRSSLRPIAQIVVFLLVLVPILIAPRCMRDKEDIVKMGKMYVLSAVILAIMGWIQIIIWNVTGINPLPIGLVDSLFSGQGWGTQGGLITHMGVNIYRMNSLSGEPKGLGQSLVIAMLLIQIVFSNMEQSPKTCRTLRLIWIFLAISVIATMSTSAFYLWILGSIAQFIAKPIFGVQKRRHSVFLLITGISCFLIAASIFTYADQNRNHTSSFTTSLLGKRTYKRGVIEDFDGLVITYLLNNPAKIVFGLGLGNAHIYAAPYTQEAMNLFNFARREDKYGTVFVAKSGYLRLISELGIVGFGLLFYGVWWHIKIIRKNKSLNYSVEDNGLINVVFLFTFTVFLCYLARGYMMCQFWATLGICVGASIVFTNRERYNSPGVPRL